MGRYQYTRSANVELELHDDALAVRFCDAEVWQWSHGLGAPSEWDDEALIDEIADAIESEAHDLAASLVKDLRARVLGEAATR